MKTKNYRLTALLICLLTCLTTACGCSGRRQTGQDPASAADASIPPDEPSGSLDITAYKSRLQNSRIPVSGYDSYEQDARMLKNADFPNISFADCRFEPFPDTDSLHVLLEHDRMMTMEESWDTIASWLEKTGLDSKNDMKKDVRVVTTEIDFADGDYPNFYENMSRLSHGGGAFLTTEHCHIQIGVANGIYSMSDGRMAAYLEDTAHTSDYAAMGGYAGDVVKEGPVSRLGTEEYPLLSGTVSVRDGAGLVRDYFSAGTPFPPAEGVSVDVPYVRIFRLDDKYGYDYTVCRQYRGVPIALTNYGTYYVYAGYHPSEDAKHAYVVDGTGISAFCGTNECIPLEELYTDTEITGLAAAAQTVSKKLAGGIRVETEKAALVYAPVTLHDQGSIYLFPCWQFTGINTVKNEPIRIYADVFTGDIYFYTKANPDGFKGT